jgi:hypothetical protein
MCFSVPMEVKKVEGNIAILENGQKARFDASQKVIPGQFVQVTGPIITSVLSKQSGKSIRKLMKESSL